MSTWEATSGSEREAPLRRRRTRGDRRTERGARSAPRCRRRSPAPSSRWPTSGRRPGSEARDARRRPGGRWNRFVTPPYIDFDSQSREQAEHRRNWGFPHQAARHEPDGPLPRTRSDPARLRCRCLPARRWNPCRIGPRQRHSPRACRVRGLWLVTGRTRVASVVLDRSDGCQLINLACLAQGPAPGGRMPRFTWVAVVGASAAVALGLGGCRRKLLRCRPRPCWSRPRLSRT